MLEVTDFEESIFEKCRVENPHISHPDVNYLREKEVMKLKFFIEQRKSEQEINNVIKANYDLLVSFLDIFNTGHHGITAVPEVQIKNHIKGFENGLIPDWLLMGKNSDGHQYYFVELKSPSMKIFVKKGNRVCLSADCNKGLNQLLSYISFAERNQSYFRDAYKFSDFENPKGLLVIGNKKDLTDEFSQQKRDWNKLMSGKITIVTWDRILESLMLKWNYSNPNNYLSKI